MKTYSDQYDEYKDYFIMVMEVTTVMVTAMTMVVVLNQALTIVKVVKNLVIKSNHPMM
ncbi:MAG: hypothetical protein ACLS5G_00060 [Streptococcus sp.]